MRMNMQQIKNPAICVKEISTWVNSVLDIDQLLELIIDTATAMMDARAASLMLLDEKRDKLYFKVATGEARDEVRKFELNPGEGIAGHVAVTGLPLLIEDIRHDPRWDRRISDHCGFATTSLACAPLKSGTTTLGVVQVIDKKDGSPLRRDDLDTLMVIADLASMALVNARKIERVRRENEDLKEELGARYRIIGNSPALHKAMAYALKVAETKTSTLILGESGTGKELVARMIHNAGPRKTMPMVILNCAALPESLLESELFGHEKGAFTGAAARKVGKFELADGGTLFLDEIGEMPLAMQAKLLRVLQNGVFYRVGGVEPVTVDVRVIAATNKNIAREVAEERFREDLYYRLNVVSIRMPALRERKEDIPLLAAYFLDKFRIDAGLHSLKIAPSALEKLTAYDWPGNVRELRNAIERAVVMGNGAEITPDDLPILKTKAQSAGVSVGLSLQEATERFRKNFIRLNLESSQGNRSRAAKVLKIQRTYLSRLISRYEL